MKKNKIGILAAIVITVTALSACSIQASNSSSANTEENVSATEQETSSTINKTENEKEIRQLLKSYRDALAESDPEKVTENYTADGVVMEWDPQRQLEMNYQIPTQEFSAMLDLI